MRSAVIVVVVGVLALLPPTVFGDLRSDEAIKLRRGALKLMGHYFTDLSEMAKGKKPYDKDYAARCAANLEDLAKMPYDFFIPGSDRGDTKARPEIWREPDKWRQSREATLVEVAKLARVARDGDLSALKEQVHATAQACKACHDEFLAK